MKKPSHYLISLPINGGYMHCYLITNDKRQLTWAGNKMCDVAENEGPGIRLNVLLSTGPLLKPHIAKVRGVIREHVEGSRAPELWAKVEDFHCTIFNMTETCPGHEILMALH